MREFFSKFTGILCFSCGFEAEVLYSSMFKKWVRKVKYCPYCGTSLAQPIQQTIFEECKER